MSISIYPGSFDPVTLGHIDIIKRAAKMTDLLIVGVLKNSAKKGLFTIEEREEMLREVTKDIPNVKVISSDKLLVNYMQENNINVIVIDEKTEELFKVNINELLPYPYNRN